MRFLFVDRILESFPGEVVRGIKHITADDHYLSMSGDGRYHFTSSLIGEALGQLAAWNVMQQLDFSKRPVAGVVASAILRRPAWIGETLALESFIDELDDVAVRYHSVATVADEVVFTVDGALGPLLPMDNFIAAEEARRQFDEINRPGDWLAAKAAQPAAVVDYDWRNPRPSIDALSFDTIVSSTPGVGLTALKKITRASAFFLDHFPRKPVLPLTVLLECKLNLAFEFLRLSGFDRAYRVREMRRIKMNDFVFPGDVVMCCVSVKKMDEHELILSFRSEVEGQRVCVMELSLDVRST